MNFNTISGHRIGLGCAPLGNLYTEIPESQALELLDYAYDHNVKYFDTAPSYGSGLSETRIGKFLDLKPRARKDIIISTKVGKILLETQDPLEPQFVHFENTPNLRTIFDYTDYGFEKSMQDSLSRLGVNKIDLLLVHDLDLRVHSSNKFNFYLEQLITSGIYKLQQLKQSGAIKAFGLGLNDVDGCLRILDAIPIKPDVILLAGRYTLLDHEYAEQELLPKLRELQIPLIIGGPYNSGILASFDINKSDKDNVEHYFEYHFAEPKVITQVRKLATIAEKYKVTLRDLALQFALLNNQVLSVIPGARSIVELQQNIAAINTKIPVQCWKEINIHATM